MALIASSARNVKALFGVRAVWDQVSWEMWVHTVHLGFTLSEGSKSFWERLEFSVEPSGWLNSEAMTIKCRLLHFPLVYTGGNS